MDIVLEPIDPCPLSDRNVLEARSDTTSLMALTSECKYLFVEEGGSVYHEYTLPKDEDVYYLGAYVGKIVYYRDPDLMEYLTAHGISKASFNTDAFPILATQSPQLDLIVFQLIRHLRKTFELDRVKLFDLGCTVAEHYDLLDTMLKASSDGRESAASVLSYWGLDRSALVLSVASLIHPRVDPQHFRLIQADGSEFSFEDRELDLSLSLGVINHSRDPMKALEKVIRATRHACVLSLWVTPSNDGFWGVNHRGAPFYFFSKADLRRLESIDGGRFLIADFLPDSESTQRKSFVGLGREKMAGIGSYHLVFTKLGDLPFSLEPLSA